MAAQFSALRWIVVDNESARHLIAQRAAELVVIEAAIIAKFDASPATLPAEPFSDPAPAKVSGSNEGTFGFHCDKISAHRRTVDLVPSMEVHVLNFPLMPGAPRHALVNKLKTLYHTSAVNDAGDNGSGKIGIPSIGRSFRNALPTCSVPKIRIV